MYFYNLNFYKNKHKAEASIIPNWEKMNKNALINAYIDHEDDPKLSSAYLSAIICRYWNNIHTYHLQSNIVVKDPTLYYDWLVSAIMRAIEKRKWKDPNNKLYDDPNGPDKVVNRCIKSERLRWFQVANKPKRSANMYAESIEQLMEDDGDLAPLPSVDMERTTNDSLMASMLVDKLLKKGDFVTAYAVCGIVNYDVFEKSKDEVGKEYIQFSKKKLLRYLNNLSDKDCEIFATCFELSPQIAIEAKNECNKLSRVRMKTALNRGLKYLQKVLKEV